MQQKKIQRHILTGLIVLVVLGSLFWWLYTRLFVSTDNAYVNANTIQIASRVSGPIDKLYVKDNQAVQSGALLFELDPATFIATVEQDKASLAHAIAKLEIAKTTAERTLALVAKKVASKEAGDIASSNLRSAVAEKKLAEAALSIAQLNLQYTKIYAPATGWITHLSLRPGDVVTANQPLFALVSSEEFWIDANFRETEIHELSIGQKAKITIDMYPNKEFRGVVESISSGTGAAFSLLPPENATGNWVKVTQRVPVRIRVLDPDPRFPLRVGSSATVTLHRNE